MGQSNWESCQRTGKRIYLTYEHAAFDRKYLGKNKNASIKNFRLEVYRCRFCKGFHVGSQYKEKQ